MPPSFNPLHDYSSHQHHHNNLYPQMKFRIGETSGENNSNNSGMVMDYMPQTQPPPQITSSPGGFYGGAGGFDKLSFADVVQFADFGPKLALNHQGKDNCEESGIDPVYFLKFPVLNDKMEDQNLMVNPNGEGEEAENDDERFNNLVSVDDTSRAEEEGIIIREDEEETTPDDNNSVQQHQHQNQFVGHEDQQVQKSNVQENKNKRKRPRSVKTTEEVESQRMTHIAVERNRRKQMNEHLRVLRSLMPGSYVQRVCQYVPMSIFRNPSKVNSKNRINYVEKRRRDRIDSENKINNIYIAMKKGV